jgi:hypothetical protein
MLTRCLAAPLLGGLLLALLGCKPQDAPPTGSPPRPPVEEEAGPPLFEEVTTASGIDFAYRNGEDLVDADGKPVLEPDPDHPGQQRQRRHLAILESLGGGVAVLDYDGDGLLDVFVPGGGFYADAPDYHTIRGHPGRLYHNLGNCKFEDVTAQVGLDKLAGGKPWFYTHGAAVGDYDRDGWPDLLVTGRGAVALFRNVPDAHGGRRFEDVTAAAGLDKGITWATSAAFADLDGDGYPDLYVCQYVDWSWENNPKCNYDGKTPDVCPPKNFSGLPHKLYRNDGKGGFVDVSKEAGLAAGGPSAGKGLGVLAVDVDGDGKPEIYVANDTVDKFFYLNKSKPGQLRFDELGLASGVARDDRGSPNGSMGLDAGDPEHTGKPALWVTNYENELHALYRNECKPGKPFFQSRTTAAGIGVLGQRYVGWGTGFLDADLDGWEDLFVANGHAIRYPTGKEVGRKQRPVLLRNQGGGKFRVASRRLGRYFETPHLARGVALADLDNDGRTDLVISHVNEPVAVLRGTGGEGCHWLGVELVGKDHADVVGARAVVEAGGTQTRFARGGGSYASSGDRRLLFGLGTYTEARLLVTWPDGTEQRFDGLAVDHYSRVTQGADKPEAYPVGK